LISNIFGIKGIGNKNFGLSSWDCFVSRLWRDSRNDSIDDASPDINQEEAIDVFGVQTYSTCAGIGFPAQIIGSGILPPSGILVTIPEPTANKQTSVFWSASLQVCHIK